MNIGELTKNANGFYTGKIVTLAVSMILALREVHSANEHRRGRGWHERRVRHAS